MKKFALGVDIGGSHISCAMVDLENGKLVEGTRSDGDVNNNSDRKTILVSWADVLKKSISNIDKNELAGVGVGMPGPFEYHTGIARFAQVEKYYSLNGVNVARELAQLLETELPFRFMNDASAFAVGEAWVGSAMSSEKSISITLGTGFGSAFVAEGIPVVDGDTVPELGCVWHLPYADGIADDYFSTRWFIKRYKEKTGEETSGARDIAEAALTKPVAASIFSEYGTNMGEFLGPWLLRFSAKVLVIGGNVTGAYALFGPYFENSIESQGVSTQIKLSMLREDAAIIGSARMLDELFWKKIDPILPRM